jgi:hypothetical protein
MVLPSGAIALDSHARPKHDLPYGVSAFTLYPSNSLRSSLMSEYTTFQSQLFSWCCIVKALLWMMVGSTSSVHAIVRSDLVTNIIHSTQWSILSSGHLPRKKYDSLTWISVAIKALSSLFSSPKSWRQCWSIRFSLMEWMTWEAGLHYSLAVFHDSICMVATLLLILPGSYLERHWQCWLL